VALPKRSDVDEAEACARLAAAVPESVREVCRALTSAGHQAVTVGGAVRDVLLGRDPGDWDIATSALPDQVVACFRRTIPTGLRHGTVTVIAGRGEHGHVEVTTFRGEGAYSDARRPDSVTFGVPLVEDLARRDLVVNAIAFDPENRLLHDPFGGRADLEVRRLRAVGDPVARFTEDGLRVMRAVRFAAQLEFSLDPETESAIVPALPSLAKVSRERVSDELRKLLASSRPSRGLAIALRTGIVRGVWPALADRLEDNPDASASWLRRVDAAATADLAMREGAFASPIADRHAVEQAFRELKFSNDEAAAAAALATAIDPQTWPSATAHAVRRKLSELGLENGRRAQHMWAHEVPVPPHATLAAQILAANDPLTLKQLAIGGKDVVDALAMPPGPAVGRILAILLERVLEDPSRNTREQLLVEAQRLELEIGR
jgi:tRNA nucleotidyltransferase (CCA-adding enzyme)